MKSKAKQSKAKRGKGNTVQRMDPKEHRVSLHTTDDIVLLPRYKDKNHSKKPHVMLKIQHGKGKTEETSTTHPLAVTTKEDQTVVAGSCDRNLQWQQKHGLSILTRHKKKKKNDVDDRVSATSSHEQGQVQGQVQVPVQTNFSRAGEETRHNGLPEKGDDCSSHDTTLWQQLPMGGDEDVIDDDWHDKLDLHMIKTPPMVDVSSLRGEERCFIGGGFLSQSPSRRPFPIQTTKLILSLLVVTWFGLVFVLCFPPTSTVTYIYVNVTTHVPSVAPSHTSKPQIHHRQDWVVPP